MSKLPESYGPLEQWKEDYNRDGTASVQALSRLAHMSRFIVGYQLRSADAHLVLFALTRRRRAALTRWRFDAFAVLLPRRF